jgi:hypothetical protein
VSEFDVHEEEIEIRDYSLIYRLCVTGFRV